MALPEKQLKMELIESLRETPFINHAVRKVGISRQTFYRWTRKSRNFYVNVNAAIQEGHKNMIEFAESALMKKVREGHFGSIKFYLENNHGNYMNRKYTLEKVTSRNTEDAQVSAHHRIPDNLVMTDEEERQINMLERLCSERKITKDEKWELRECVFDGTLEQRLRRLGIDLSASQ